MGRRLATPKLGWYELHTYLLVFFFFFQKNLMFLSLFNLEGFVVLGVWLCSPICMASPSDAISPTPCVMQLNYEEGNTGREAKKVRRIFSLQGAKVGQAMKVLRGSVLSLVLSTNKGVVGDLLQKQDSTSCESFLRS